MCPRTGSGVANLAVGLIVDRVDDSAEREQRRVLLLPTRLLAASLPDGRPEWSHEIAVGVAGRWVSFLEVLVVVVVVMMVVVVVGVASAVVVVVQASAGGRDC